MQKIRDYIDRFFRKTKKNQNYTMKIDELFVFMNEIIDSKDSNGALHAVNLLFNFGYVKGYRAALAEMKKGGNVYE